MSCEDYYPNDYWTCSDEEFQRKYASDDLEIKWIEESIKKMEKSNLDKWLENTKHDKRTIITFLKMPLCKIKKLLLGGK